VPGHPGSMPHSQATGYTEAHKLFHSHFQIRAQNAYALRDAINIRADLGFNSRKGKFEKIRVRKNCLPVLHITKTISRRL